MPGESPIKGFGILKAFEPAVLKKTFLDWAMQLMDKNMRN